MKLRFANGLRLLGLAGVGAVGVLATQSCDDNSARTRNSAAPVAPRQIPADAAGAVDAAVARAGGNGEASPILCSEGGEKCPSEMICCPQCCRANLPPVCVQAVDGGCPLPDLTVDEGALAMRTYLETIDGDPCEVEEKCLGGPGKRKVLRFDASVPNRGVRDLVLGNPDAGDGFVWATCHKHYHFTAFASYRLVSEDDQKVVLTGRKQAFCARDSARLDRSAPVMPKYDCGMQGIQAGWTDIYDPALPCQFLDVTDVPSGNYRLEVEVNPDRTITELRYDNNLGSIRVRLP